MVNVQWNICVYVDVVGFRISFILVGVSLRTMTAISVDRLLAVLLELRYRQVVTLLCFILKRTYMIVIAVQTGRTNCFFGSVILEFPHNLMLCHHGYITVSSDLNLLLHK